MNLTTRMQQSIGAAIRKVQHSFFEPAPGAAYAPSAWSHNGTWHSGNSPRPRSLAVKRSDTNRPPAHPQKPLRVLRFVESGMPRASVGRMVISGRMADVCAELDRMAAQEIATH